MKLVPLKYDVWLVALDPVIGSEIAKTRPCVVVSKSVVNRWVRTLVVAPLTSTQRKFPFRPPVRFGDTDGDCAIDHTRAVDRSRLVKRLGALSPDDRQRVGAYLKKFFDTEDDDVV